MKKISNQGMVEILTRIIEIIQSDGCDGCAYAKYVEWENPCTICKRCKHDYYRKEINPDESTST